MFVELSELHSKPEETVTSVLNFIGADPTKLPAFKPLPVVSGDRRGRRMHPAVRRKLQHYFAAPNQKLFALLGKEYPTWGEWAPSCAADEEEGGVPLPIIPVVHAGRGGKELGAAKTKASKPVIEQLLPGASPRPQTKLPGRKESNLVKRVVSISARV